MLQFFPERINIRTDCIFEMSHFTFIVVAHINDDGVCVIRKSVKFQRIYMNTGIGYIKGSCRLTHRQQFFYGPVS